MSPTSPISERVQGYIDAFQLLTGYMVIFSLDLPKTMRVNPFLTLLEIRAGLSDEHVRDCLETAEDIIGDRSAAAFLSIKLGRTDTGSFATIRN